MLNELPEAEAKKMANSFIDELGRKYDKINHGCTYTEYDTAMRCWTSATNDKRTFLLITMMTCIWSESREWRGCSLTIPEAILKCLQLIDCCYSEDSVLYGCNADGIYSTSSKMNFRNKKDISLAQKTKKTKKLVKHSRQIPS